MRWQSLLHLVVRCLSASRDSSTSSSGTELRQLPPAQHQQVNQCPQPHQHRHGHRQPPTETLHFPVRRSRRRPQPGCCQNPILEKRQNKWKNHADPPTRTNSHAQLCPVPQTVKHWLQSARSLSHTLSTLTEARALLWHAWQPWARACLRACVFVCESVCFSEGVLDPPGGLNGRAWSSTCRHPQLLHYRRTE